jgi:NitT/TauT family transport system permease protein
MSQERVDGLAATAAGLSVYDPADAGPVAAEAVGAAAAPRSRLRSRASGQEGVGRTPFLNTRLGRTVPPVVALALLIGLWQVLIPALGIREYLIPTPAEVGAAIGANATSLVHAVGTTAMTAVIGFLVSAVVGTATGFVLAHSRFLERSTMSLLIVLWTAPTVAIAPIVIVWFGIGQISVVVIAMVTCFFPIVANVLSGVRSVSESTRDLFEVYGAARRKVLWSLELPSALPQLFAALKITAALAIVGTVSGEYVAGVGGGAGGLGYIIIVTGSRLETSYLFAASIISAVLGIIVYTIVGAVERMLLGQWHESARDVAQF